MYLAGVGAVRRMDVHDDGGGGAGTRWRASVRVAAAEEANT